MVVGVYFGVKNKSVPKENGLVESSSTNTLNIDTSNLVKEELYSEGQGKKIYGYITAPKNYKNQKYIFPYNGKTHVAPKNYPLGGQ